MKKIVTVIVLVFVATLCFAEQPQNLRYISSFEMGEEILGEWTFVETRDSDSGMTDIMQVKYTIEFFKDSTFIVNNEGTVEKDDEWFIIERENRLYLILRFQDSSLAGLFTPVLSAEGDLLLVIPPLQNTIKFFDVCVFKRNE